VVQGPAFLCVLQVLWPLPARIQLQASLQRPAHNVRLPLVCSALPQRHRARPGQLGCQPHRVRETPCAQVSPARVHHAPGLLKGCALPPPQVKFGPELRCGQVGRPVPVDPLQDFRNAPEAGGDPGRLPLAASAPVQPALVGFPKLSQENLFTRASLRRGAVGRS
jgi:hypothetical protein